MSNANCDADDSVWVDLDDLDPDSSGVHRVAHQPMTPRDLETQAMDELCELAKAEGWYTDTFREEHTRALDWAIRGILRKQRLNPGRP